MTVISVVKDAEARTMTITARFDAPIDRVWQVWSDPRQLERWWGPPSYPATVTEHNLALIAKVTRTRFATRLTPQLAQPWIDLYAEFGRIQSSFPASDLTK